MDENVLMCHGVGGMARFGTEGEICGEVVFLAWVNKFRRHEGGGGGVRGCCGVYLRLTRRCG